MRNKVVLLVFFVAVVFVFSNCDRNKSLNPNGDSELAVLMRAMADSTDAWKQMTLQNKMPQKFPDAFLKIHTATASDSMMKTPEFDALATSYVEGLNLFYQSSPSELKTNYNSLVQRCINCHNSHCPGPLKRIKKMVIEE
ncbi:MAG: hypothetical protein POELPBGB_02707 [Bacteroidia bacterium]|nr:hypothetical protein [Bacteroidia bacterium]